jgi:DNA-binding transcriptional LysR family regulator
MPDDFCTAYPDIDVEIIAEDAIVDLAARGHDADICIGELLEADMISVCLSTPFRNVIVATPGYFETHGRPQTLAHLNSHNCIRQRLSSSGGLFPWRFSDGNRGIEVNVKCRIIVNYYSTVGALVERGLGQAQISGTLFDHQITDGRLDTVLDHLAPTSPGLSLHYPGHAQVLPKLCAFIDFLKAAMADGRLPRLHQ